MTLEILLAHPAVQALGQALLHFIWQGSLLALFLWIVKTIVPSSAARFRYAVASLIMLMMPIALIVTATWNSRSEPGSAGPAPRFSIQAPAATPERIVHYAPTLGAPHAGISGWVVCIWMMGVLLLSARAAGGWMGVRKLKRGANPAGAELEDIFRRLKRGLRVSAPVRLGTSAMVRVPTAIGWLRPYILLPVTALTGLSETQIAAILAHELAHISRRDYLLNILQTAVETVLFYHPAVWWVGRQMRLEREHCCDDIAVGICGSAFEYASALAEMEQLRDRIPAPALAATGGDLLGRIRRVLGRQDSTSWSLGGIAGTALVLLIAGATAIVSLYAAPQVGLVSAPRSHTQSQSRQQPVALAFEVASIKANKSMILDASLNKTPGGGLEVVNQTLRTLVGFAYDLRDDQISGGPSWLEAERYDILAKAPAGTRISNPATPWIVPSDDPVRVRLQTLLAERFHLAVHRETKKVTVLALMQDKAGAKLQPWKDGDLPGPSMRLEYTKLTCRKYSMEQFATVVLSRHLGTTVVDKTGIAGEYNFVMSFQPDSAGAASDAVRGPTFLQALQDQLGLKLERQKGTVEILVIDHAQKPDPN